VRDKHLLLCLWWGAELFASRPKLLGNGVCNSLNCVSRMALVHYLHIVYHVVPDGIELRQISKWRKLQEETRRQSVLLGPRHASRSREFRCQRVGWEFEMSKCATWPRRKALFIKTKREHYVLLCRTPPTGTAKCVAFGSAQLECVESIAAMHGSLHSIRCWILSANTHAAETHPRVISVSFECMHT
jgi:hypothetical protein